jgi:hypothetical protein
MRRQQSRRQKRLFFLHQVPDDGEKHRDGDDFHNWADEKTNIIDGSVDRIQEKIQYIYRNNQKKIVESGPVQIASEGSVAARDNRISPVVIREKVSYSNYSHVIVRICKIHGKSVHLQIIQNIRDDTQNDENQYLKSVFIKLTAQ